MTPPEARYFTENPDHPIVEALAYGWSQETQIVGADGATYDTRRYGVTEQFFDVFGTHMELGPGFARHDAGPIVISYPIWRDLFGSDPDIVGKSIQVEGSIRQVVGVAPESFEFPENPGYWSLMNLGPGYDRTRYRAYVRLRPERTEAQFQAELNRLPAELGPDPATGVPMTYVAQPFLDYVVGDLRATVKILMGATVILLLIACINVTNLMLSRATANAREVALREALGAGRGRILRRLMTESVVLAFAGGALGLAIGAVGVRLLLTIGPALPRLDAVPMDGTVLAFALGVTLVTGLLIGLAPAWRLPRSEIHSLVNQGGRGARGGGPNRIFGPLVVAEVALAVMLVIGAGLLVRTYSNLTTTDPGFDPDRAVTLYMYLPGRTTLTLDSVTPDGQPRFELYPSIVGASVARERLGMSLLVVFGLVALLLAAFGIYGLMSHVVAQRTGEIAVRSAMGATAGRVLGLVMRRGVSYALVGIALGVIGAAALRRVLESQLYGVSALDVPVFVLVPMILLGVASLACFLPSRRATRIHPAELLRIE